VFRQVIQLSRKPHGASYHSTIGYYSAGIADKPREACWSVLCFCAITCHILSVH